MCDGDDGGVMMVNRCELNDVRISLYLYRFPAAPHYAHARHAAAAARWRFSR